MLDTLEPRPKQKLRPEPRKYTPPLAIPNDSKESPFNFLIFCRRRISKNTKGSLFFTYFGTVTSEFYDFSRSRGGSDKNKWEKSHRAEKRWSFRT